MACPVCPELNKYGNEAAHQGLDHFERFYGRYLIDEEDKLSMHDFKYESLRNKAHTRVLELYPGENNESIECGLSEASIDNPPRYAALSYTWGTRPRSRTVMVNGQSFLVTDNLWAALWHLRLPSKKRVLWIDAICIDQSNIEERNRVVLRMKDIYERAEKIIAWLGPEGEKGGLAMECLEIVFNQYCRLFDQLGSDNAALDYMLEHRSWTGEGEAGAPLSLRELNPLQKSPERAWVAIKDLLQGRTWFRRVWIVQEGTSPVPTTFYLCDRTLPAQAMWMVFRLLKRIPLDTFPINIVNPMYADHIEALATFARKRSDAMRMGTSKTFPVIEVLETFRDHSAGDPHDKVYPALGFSQDMRVPIKVDYGKKVSEMMRDVAVSCLHEPQNNLRFLGHAGLLGTAHMPATWIPDWLHVPILSPFPKEVTRGRSSDAGSLFDACATDHKIWTDESYAKLHPSVEGDTLTVYGILVDYVRSFSVEGGLKKNLDSIENVWIMPNMHKEYALTGETLEEAYLRTLVADLRAEAGEIIGRGGSMYWRNRLGTPPPPNHFDILHLLRSTCRQRRFITTLYHRFIGLAPGHVQPGDAIFVLKGGEMLYIARPTLDGTYHFVGEAYIHGLMDGQIIKDFARGQGTLQTIEFVPVRESKKPRATEPGKPVNIRSRDRGYGVTGVEYSNPLDDFIPFIHNDTGSSMDSVIMAVIEGTMVAYAKAGISEEESFRLIFREQLWIRYIEDQLLSDEETPSASSSRFQPAGRIFARQSYVRAALELEKERMRAQMIGRGLNVVLNQFGEIPIQVLDVDFAEGEEKNSQMADDERMARELHAEEQAAANDAARQSTQSLDTGTNAAPSKAARARNRFPLLERRTGPPVRLMMAETISPCTFSYSLQSDGDFEEMLEEFKASGFPYDQVMHGGRESKRPLLWGRWATDPKKRPYIELHTFGHPPDIWWEDENGEVVEGPNVMNNAPPKQKMTVSIDEVSRLSRLSYFNLDGKTDRDTDPMFPILEGKSWRDSHKKNLVTGDTNAGQTEDSWMQRISTGQWESNEEADPPQGFRFAETDSSEDQQEIPPDVIPARGDIQMGHAEASWVERIRIGEWESDGEADPPSMFSLTI